MSKIKSAAKAAKPSKDVLSKVKDAGVAKSGQSTKVKGKEVAKQVAAKEEKRVKEKKSKKAPIPDPVSETEEEEENSSEDSESSESESEVETKKPAIQSATKASKKRAAANESDESEDDSDDDGSDEAPVAEVKTNGTKALKKDDSSDDSEDDSDDDNDEDVAPAAVLGTAPAVDKAKDESEEEDDDSDDDDDDEAAAKPKVNGANAKKDESSDEESDDDSDSSEDDDEEKQAEEKPAAKVNKRKAEEESEATTKKAKPDTADAGQSKNLFVGNLSWNIDEDWLRSEFENHGELTGVRVMYDKATNRSKGFGYVEFKNVTDAAAAHDAMKGYELDGRALNVDYASVKPDNKDKLDTRRKSYGDQLSETSSTLFLGNLSFDVGQEMISEAFSEHGTILSVRLPTDRETGQPKGYGYVEFETVEYATTALEALQGSYIGNRPVRIDYSTPRPQNNDGGRGGGFSRGGRGGGGFNSRGRGRGNDRGGRGGGGFGQRGGRGGSRGGRGQSTNRGGFGDFSGRKVSFD